MHESQQRLTQRLFQHLTNYHDFLGYSSSSRIRSFMEISIWLENSGTETINLFSPFYHTLVSNYNYNTEFIWATKFLSNFIKCLTTWSDLWMISYVWNLKTSKYLFYFLRGSRIFYIIISNNKSLHETIEKLFFRNKIGFNFTEGF